MCDNFTVPESLLRNFLVATSDTQALVSRFFIEAWPFYALGVKHPKASGFLVGYGQQKAALPLLPIAEEEALKQLVLDFEAFKKFLGSKGTLLPEETLVVLFSLKSYFQETFVETKVWSLILLEDVSYRTLRPILSHPIAATSDRLFSPLWASVRSKELALVETL